MQLLEHQYVSNVDPLDSQFFDFNEFWLATEKLFQEKIQKMQAELASDSDNDDSIY